MMDQKIEEFAKRRTLPMVEQQTIFEKKPYPYSKKRDEETNTLRSRIRVSQSWSRRDLPKKKKE